MSRPRNMFFTKIFLTLSFFTIVFLLFFIACRKDNASLAGKRGDSFSLSEWSANQSIYEVNIRQYSVEGTFKAFEKHLPRLKKMGIGILWFMPIHPIGDKNRKGSLGSYYSVKDYMAVNPEFGTMEDFKRLVRQIHDIEMIVIIDWVANHTAWDNTLTINHPDWFTRDQDGNFVSPVPDWTDVIDLNYDHPQLRAYMIDALKFWVEEVDVDGFRCDVAEMVPLDFWKNARFELDKIKSVFMLAEGDSPELYDNGFDMTYNWNLFHLMNDLAEGKKTTADLKTYLDKEHETFRKTDYRMTFTSNHDENTWNGTVFERLGRGVKTFTVLAATIGGMPLVYSGQEAGLAKRLKFFDRDPIDWRDHELSELYTTLLNLEKENRALWNGIYGGRAVPVVTSKGEAVFAFVREKEDDRVFVVLNLSGEDLSISLKSSTVNGDYEDVFSREKVSLMQGTTLHLKPWGFKVFAR